MYGKTGRGKTHLAVAIAYRAIQNGFDAFFTTAAALIDDLSRATREGRFRERGRFITLDGPSYRTRHLKLDEPPNHVLKPVRISGNARPEFLEPTMVMEEIDSLVNETSVTRAGLLSQLDGLTCSEGLLMLATTNNPANVDPALADRPSRFDRVWDFEPPASRLRRRYIADKTCELASEVMDQLVRGTEGWSLAYLNELRTTAAVLSINRGLTALDEAVILDAHRLLSRQFISAKRNHRVVTNEKRIGFTRIA